ncbi:hypothetical protein DFH07DRAFT_1018273 [Mycena maculata]|uniref:Uncharacterized protein n=1 Tax=Mycena maculata TaxID=230809 RepID=A0AAD7JGU7_9AGAR|nr:hypothetical protein DFH07DRAFT_1018273 [Mycena maculata]
MDSDSSVSPLLSLACRFLPHDQWFTTHVDPDWKVRQVKSWLLSKCLPYAAPPSPPLRQSTRKPQRAPSPITFAPDPRHRPISPITFAMPNHTPAPDSDLELEDAAAADSPPSSPEEQIILPAPPKERKRAVLPTITTGAKGDLFAQFTLLRFATGQLLEDDLPLSFYDLHADELLELHRLGVVVALPRAHPKRYLDAYWEGWVRVLRMRPVEDEEDAWPLYRVRTAETRTLEWRERWLVVREGIVYLCRDESRLIHTLPLTELAALTNASALPPAATPPTTTRILLARFQAPLPSAPASTASMSAAYAHAHSHAPTRAASPLLNTAANASFATTTPSTTGHTLTGGSYTHLAGSSSYTQTLNSAYTDPFASEHGSESSSALSSPVFAHDSSGSDRPRRKQGNRRKRAKRPEHEFLALDLKDDSAYVSLLRVLHRHALPASTFVAALPVASHAHAYTRSPRSPRAPAEDREEEEEEEEDAPPLRHPPSLAQLHLHVPRSSSLGALPFPEWRAALLGRARRAGLGRIGRAVEWRMRFDREGEEGDEDDGYGEGWEGEGEGINGLGMNGEKGKGKERAPRVRQPTSTDGYDSDVSGDGSSFTEDDPEASSSDSDDSQGRGRGRTRGTRSETEWVAWMGDLRRQARVAKETRIRLLAREEARRRADAAREAELAALVAGEGGGEGVKEVTVSRVGVDDRSRRRAMEPSAVVTSLSGSNPPQAQTQNPRYSTYAQTNASGSGSMNTHATPAAQALTHALSSPSSAESLGSGSGTGAFGFSPLAPPELEDDQLGPQVAMGAAYGAHTRAHSHTLLHSVSMHEVVGHPSGDGFGRRPSMPVLGWGAGSGGGSGGGSRAGSVEREQPPAAHQQQASGSSTGVTEVRRTGSVGPGGGRGLLRKKDKERERESEREKESDRREQQQREKGRPRLSLSTGSSARPLVQSSLSPPATPREGYVAPLAETPAVPVKKKRRGLAHGVSMRAEKFIKSLDPALDFVDGR